MSALNMSLYYVFTHSMTLWPEAYNCPEDYKQSDLTRPVLGSYFLVSGVVFLTLYVPCFIAILKLKCRTPAFGLMLLLSIFDLLALCVNSLATGVFNIIGISYCESPLFIFIIGAIGGGSWMGGCLASALLAIERCAEVNPRFFLGFLFCKKVFPLVIILVICYGIYSMGFVKPVLFTVEYSCWFFDPQIGKDIVLQALILCMFHAVDAALYEYMKFFYSSPILILMSQFMWQWSSGCMCIAYLTLNRTIRTSVIKMCLPKKIRMKFGLYAGFEEHLEQTKSAGAAHLNAVGMAIKFDNFVCN
uniref:Serpentine Receptor, class T n=1 Tax=Caenorhabditis tropicalis TaxID=1561998 RepID=A0A1I7T907_9PELO